MVSRPAYVGGLGFGFKWDMGWMHDTLEYFARDPIFRKFHHNELTFRTLYAFTENFVLPLSHDEVVHGKGSLLGKMPGDEWQKFANLRAPLRLHVGPARQEAALHGRRDRPVARVEPRPRPRLAPARPRAAPRAAGLRPRPEPALPAASRRCTSWTTSPGGFEWVDCNDSEASVLTFLRRGRRPEDVVLVACNFTPEPRPGYRVGVPADGFWRELLNSDAAVYGGAGWGNMGGKDAEPVPHHGRPLSLSLTLPPLGAVFLKRRGLTPEGPRA